MPPLQTEEPIQDPRNLYASDSPVFEEIDSDQGRYKSADEFEGGIDPEGQGDGMAGDSNARLNVPLFHITCVPLLIDASSHLHSQLLPVHSLPSRRLDRCRARSCGFPQHCLKL